MRQRLGNTVLRDPSRVFVLDDGNRAICYYVVLTTAMRYESSRICASVCNGAPFSHRCLYLRIKSLCGWESLKQRSHLVKFLWQIGYTWMADPSTCDENAEWLASDGQVLIFVDWLNSTVRTHAQKGAYPSSRKHVRESWLDDNLLPWKATPTVCDEMSRPLSFSDRPTDRPTFLWLLFLKKKYAIVFVNISLCSV